jgi:hypothetical protein
LATQWTTPKTWATNDVLTAADLNTYTRDNSSWAITDKPSWRLTNSSSQVISTGTYTALTFDTELIDNGLLHSTASSSSRVTIPSAAKAGLYLMGACVLWAYDATDDRQLLLRVNGTNYIVADNGMAITTGAIGVAQNVTTVYPLVSGDYVEMIVGHNAAPTLNSVFAANYAPICWGTWIGT